MRLALPPSLGGRAGDPPALVNPDLDVPALAAAFAASGRLQIDDFLAPRLAEALYASLTKMSEQGLWYQVQFGDPAYHDPASKAGAQRHFSYQYEKYPVANMTAEAILASDSRRSLKAPRAKPELPASHPLRVAGALLNSAACHRLIAAVTGRPLYSEKAVIFASKYRPGDFNSTHFDGPTPPRQVAFVLNLTRDWLVHWGGNLVVLERDLASIAHAYAPRFNSLVLFQVPLPHAVLPISQHARVPRLAVSGWFLGPSRLG